MNTYKHNRRKQREKAVRAEIIITVTLFIVLAVVGYNALFWACKWLCSVVPM